MSLLLARLHEADGLRVVFQPIYEFDARGNARLHGVEGLVRGPLGTNLERADVLFEYVRRKRVESSIDRLCVERIICETRALRGTPRCSLNVHASTLGRDSTFVGHLAACAERHGLAASRITVEIVEQLPVWEGPGFARALAELRELGVRIALDDVGAGYSNYAMMLDTRPDYLKIDRYLVTDCQSDPSRRAVLRSIAELSGALGARAVAEGIDSLSALHAVLSQGITLVQGFLLSAPREPSVEIAEELWVPDTGCPPLYRSRPLPLTG